MGIDGDPGILAIATRKAIEAGVAVRFDRGLSFELPYADAYFDRILSSRFCHHLSWRDKERTAAGTADRSPERQARGFSVPRMRSAFQMALSFIGMTVPSLSTIATSSFMKSGRPYRSNIRIRPFASTTRVDPSSSS
jgi:hypothetical protein